MSGDRDVVERILAFEVDDGPVPLGFRDRLARENGWSRTYAARVYDEYLRFLVLAFTGEQPSTPSDEVDQAWHLHLTYTRSYWDRLCGEVLERPLHHGPTTGTTSDGARYRELYATTLDRYRELFGEEPPPDIWPDVDERFRDPARWQRLDTRDNLVVRRAPVVAGATGVGLVLALAAAAASESSTAFLLPFVVGVLATVTVLASWGGLIGILTGSRKRKRRRQQQAAAWGGWGATTGAAGCQTTGCSDYPRDTYDWSTPDSGDSGGSGCGSGDSGSSGCGGGGGGCGGGGCGGGGCGS